MLYPIGSQNFENIRKKGFVYVDKTEYIYKMASAGQYYFLSRPRRFGKTLLVSTMEAYFSGRKELFKGLAIEKLEQDWIEYPVLSFDMSAGKVVDGLESLYSTLNNELSWYEKEYGTDPTETNIELRFKGIIRRAYEKAGRQVVILIDEYDKPLLDTIDNRKTNECIRDFLRGFYGNVKSQDRYIRFAFLTGITKFSHVNIFSGLNNLDDISMDLRYSEICGITTEEIHTYFGEAIRELAESKGMSYEQALRKLETHYDGYHFHQNSVGIYNPFSLLSALEKEEINNYWFRTGTPSYLVKLLQQNNYEIGKLENVSQTADQLEGIDPIDTNIVPLLFQSGYLTIRGYDERFRKFILGYPNKEVEEGFVNYLMPCYFSFRSGNSLQFFVENFIHDVEAGDADGFMNRLKVMFDDNSFRVAGKMEIYYQNTMNAVFWMMGLYTEVERASSMGSADIVIKTAKFIYIMELKLDSSVDTALKQIEEKGYARPYALDKRKVYRIGVNFSSATRSIADWRIE
ncbi:MAG: ATP-binding protein [Bacteroidales bacterium]|nr:ATP-binding protein [Bacteroidales bacterium]